MKKRICLVLVILLLTGCSPMFAGDTSVNLPEQEHLYNSGEFIYDYKSAEIDLSNAPLMFYFNPQVDKDKIDSIEMCRMDDKGMLYAYQGATPNVGYDAEQIEYESAKQKYTEQQAYWDSHGQDLLLEYDAAVAKYIADAESILVGNRGRAGLYTLATTIYRGKLQLWEKLTAAGETATRPTEPRKDDEAYRQYPPPAPPPPAPKAPVEPTAPPAEYMITEVVYIERVNTSPGTSFNYRTVLSLKSPPSSNPPSMFFKELDINDAAAGAMLYFGGRCYLITPGTDKDGKYTMQVSYEYNLAPAYSRMLAEFANVYGAYQDITIMDMLPHVNNDGFIMSTMITTDLNAMSETTTEEEAEKMSDNMDAGSKYANLNVSFVDVTYTSPEMIYTFDAGAQYVESIRIADDLYEYTSETGTPPLQSGERYIRGGYINRANGYMINDMDIGLRLSLDAEYENQPQMTYSAVGEQRVQCAKTTIVLDDTYVQCFSKAGTLWNSNFVIGKAVNSDGETVDCVTVTPSSASTEAIVSETHFAFYENMHTAAIIPIPKDLPAFNMAYVAVTDTEIVINMRLIEKTSIIDTTKWRVYRIKLSALSAAAGYSGEEEGHTYIHTNEDGVEETREAKGVGQVDLYGPHSVTILSPGEFMLSSLTNGIIHWKDGECTQLLANPTYRIWNQEGIGKARIWEIMAFEQTGVMHTYADIARLRWINVKLA